MRVLVWHVHGSWMTAFVQGDHHYLIPVLPGRGPDGRGRARTWDWPARARELPPEDLRDEAAGGGIDLVVLQRPQELDLLRRWTGLRAGVDVPAVYVEHNTPPGPAPATVHPLAERDDIPVAHVTCFNQVMWDCGRAPTTVVEHGVVDPGYRYTGELQSLAVVVNEPVRRARVAGTDLALRVGATVQLDVYGMGVRGLAGLDPALSGHLHEDLPQADLHERLGRHRAYLHPYRWTSLGLALIEAMTLGLPVLGLSTTDAPEAVPPGAGVLSNDVDRLVQTARRWLGDPQEAREVGQRARRHATSRYGLARFLTDWDALMKEVVR